MEASLKTTIRKTRMHATLLAAIVFTILHFRPFSSETCLETTTMASLILILILVATQAFDFEPDQIVVIANLKPEKRKNSIVEQRARMMSNSLGIIMDPSIQINSKNAREVRVRWIGNDSITLGINPKYLSRAPGIVIHDIPIHQETVIDVQVLIESLEKDANKNVYIPFVLHNSDFESIDNRALYFELHEMYSHVTGSLSIDKFIEFDVLREWVDIFLANSSRNLHVINQEADHELFSLQSLVNISQYLPMPFVKLINHKTVSCKNWIKYKAPTESSTPQPTELPEVKAFEAFDWVIARQLDIIKKCVCTRKKSRLTPFIIHKALASENQQRTLVQNLSNDPTNIVMVWQDKGNQWSVNDTHNNVFYQSSFSEYLRNAEFLQCLNALDDPSVISNHSQLASTLLTLFPILPESIMTKTLVHMKIIYPDPNILCIHFIERLNLMASLTKDSVEVIIASSDREHLKQKIESYKKHNLSFWRLFGRQIKRALTRITAIRIVDDLRNAAAFEARVLWEGINVKLGGAYSLHIVPPNDKVFSRAIIKRLGTFWQFGELKSVTKWIKD